MNDDGRLLSEESGLASPLKMTSHRVCELLHQRHQPPQFACWTEMRGGTGYSGYIRHPHDSAIDQRIDFFAINTWPSQAGCIAYEIKVDRGDWLRELKQPRKRLFAERVAHECYFAAPWGIIRPDEVPEGWGLIVVSPVSTKLTIHATRRVIRRWPLRFLLAVARRAGNCQEELRQMTEQSQPRLVQP